MLKQRKNPNVSGIKITMFILVLFCFSFAFANDIMQPVGNERIPIGNYNKENFVPAYKYPSRDNTPVPDYEFIGGPDTIMTSYYDYMPGSYEGYPIRYQTDNGNGYYLTWFAKPSPTANRRQYWAYVDSEENIVDWGTISTDDVLQGYGGIAIHPATGDAIATWHQNHAVLGYVTTICYDDFALLGIPGNWSSYYFFPPPLPDEYLWPLIYVGPSPLGEDYVRVYQTAKNYLHNSFGHPCENPRIMYIDVENSLFTDMTVLLNIDNWSEVILMYDWREKDCRPLSQPFAIDPNTPGKVAIMGYVEWLSGDLGNMPVDEGIFVWESYDYGETWDTANLHSSGSSILYYVENIFGDVPEFFEVGVCGWHNTAVYDYDGNLHLTYLQQYGFTDTTGSYYLNHFLPQAEAIWDGSEFTFDEVPEMPGIDPLSGHSVPWEIDPFGNIILYVTVGCPPSSDGPFHENTQKNAINFENGWMLQMWADGTYFQLALDEIPEYLPYLEHPIIFISVSSDNGNTWSEPIELTDIFDENGEPTQFYEQITCYPYVCDKIIDLGNDWGQVTLYYLDDNTFGSLDDDGGQIVYCSIKIDFSGEAVEPDSPQISNLSLKNYPNPFTSSTRISFSVPKGLKNPSIKIYNIKGQLIKNFGFRISYFGFGEAIWYGKDSNNNDVVSGIYLYKLETDNGSITRKMLLSR